MTLLFNMGMRGSLHCVLPATQRLDLNVAEQSGERRKACLCGAEVCVQGRSARLGRGNILEEVN